MVRVMQNSLEHRYVSEEIGVLACEGGPDEVMFHVNQVRSGQSWIARIDFI